MKGLLLGRVGASVAIAVTAAALTWSVTDGGGGILTTAGPAAWVDDPLDGSVLPSDVGELTVVAHATDPDGIVTVVLSVDGDEIDTAEASGDDLVKVDLRWSPPGPGTYELSVVGVDPGGTATPPGTASVQVGSDEEQPATTTTTTLPNGSTLPDAVTSSTDEVALDTTSTRPSATSSTTSGPTTSATASTTSTTRPPSTSTTATPRTTTTTTAPPCSPNMPVNTSPADGASVGSRTPTLQWDYRGCAPDLFRIVVTPSRELAPVEAGGTVVGTDRQWTTPTLSCGTHWFHVRAESGSNIGAWSSPTSFSVYARVC